MRAAALTLVGVLLACVAVLAQGASKAPEYDPASELTVRGVVLEIHESKVATDHPGLHLVLRTESEVVEIHACPVRFLRELEFPIETGDTLSVLGSRAKKGNVIVAREITRGQLSVILRDKTGAPNWLPRRGP